MPECKSLKINGSAAARASYGPADRLRNTGAPPACRSSPPAPKWHATGVMATKFFNGIKHLRVVSRLSLRLARGVLSTPV